MANSIVRPPPPPAPVKIIAHRVRQHGHAKGSEPLHESRAAEPTAHAATAAEHMASASALAARAAPKDANAAVRSTAAGAASATATTSYAAAVKADAEAAHTHALEQSKRHPLGVFYVYLVPDSVTSGTSKTGLEPNPDGHYERAVAAYQDGAEIHIT